MFRSVNNEEWLIENEVLARSMIVKSISLAEHSVVLTILKTIIALNLLNDARKSLKCPIFSLQCLIHKLVKFLNGFNFFIFKLT